MKYVIKCTRRSYAIELNVDDLIQLYNVENDYDNPLSNNTLMDQFNKLFRAPDVEYNGHFGNYIYLTLDDDEDTPENHQKISDMIEKQIMKAKLS